MRNLINLTEVATATPRSPTSLRASAKLDSKINFSVAATSSHSSFGYHSIMLTEFGDFSDLKPKNGKVERAKAILHAELYDFKELARKMQRVEIDDIITCMCPFYGQDKVCVGTQNGSVWIVNLISQDKELLEHNTASKESISAIALTSDNKYLATGGEKGSLSLFDLENKVLKYSLENSHNGKISAVLLTQNSKRVMAASVEGSVKVYDIGTLNVLYNFPSAQKNGISLMARTFDDHYLILASGNTAKIINLKGKSEFDIPNDSHENITSLIVTSDSKSVIFGTAGGTIKIYSIPRKRTLHTLRASQNLEAITSLAITSDGCYLFASSTDGYVQFINLVSNEKIGSVANLHPERISCATFTSNNRYLVTGSHDKCIKVLQLKQHDECIETIKNAHTAPITAITLTPEEKYVISASSDKSICTIDLDDAKVIHKLDGSGSNNIIINCMAMASKIPKLIAGCIDGSIRIFDRKVMNLEHIICDAHTEQINAIAVTADDKLIVSGSEDKSVKIFDLQTRVCVYMFEDYFKGPVTSIAITPNNKYIICGSQDCCIKGFELKNKVSALGFLHAHTGAVTCLAVSSDNEYIVSGSADKSIRVFEIKYEECIHVFENAHHDTITAVAVTSNGKYIVSASLDGLIKVFDWKNRRCIHSFLGNGGEPITALLVSKDAWEITSASKYGSISLSINPLIRMEKSISTSETESMAAYKTFFDLLTLWKFLDKSTPCSFKQKFIKANPKAIVYPEGWNLFHLVTLFNDHSLELLSACIEAKVPFTIDSFAMTPLHHLILAKNKDLQAINYLLSRFGEIVPVPNSLAVVSSLSTILPSIVKINNASVAQFLQCSTAIPPSYQYHKVPKFGSILKGKHSGSLMIQNDRIRITLSTDNVFNYKIRDKLIDPQGTSQLALEMLQFEMDFADPSSDDLFRIANMLNSSKVDNSDIFNTPAVSILIDFLWVKHKLFFQIQLLLFSALVALISIYGIPSVGNQQLCIEILIFCMSIYFLMAEVVQYWAIKRTISFWFHFSSLVLVYIPVMIIVIWALEDKDVKHWLVSFALLGAYGNWVSFFKVFDQTRNLIHIIFETGRDIRSFLIILGLIIVGFSLMMYQFDTDGTFGYGDRFLSVYSLLYGQYDTDDFNTPQVVYLTIVTVILAVVLLNLLVAIMSETYTRVQSSRNLTDSKERLKMIVGAMSFKRKARKILRGYLNLLRRRTKYAVAENPKGFLYFVKKSKQEIAESAGKNNKWENHLNQIKTILKGEVANIEVEFKEQIERQEQRLIEHFKSQFEQQFRIQQEKLDDMMHYIKRMKMDNDKSSVAEEELPPLRLRSYASDTAHARELHVFGKLKG